MLDYSKGIKREADEVKYLGWLREHPTGLVVSLNRGRSGQYSLHRAACQTISYDLGAKGQKERTGKVCFDTCSELEAWCTERGQSVNDLNRCQRC